MDPLTALGLTANILDVVSFSATIVEAGTQICKSGSTVEHRELKMVAESLESLSGKLADPMAVEVGCLTEDEQRLRDLAISSFDIATKLSSALTKIYGTQPEKRQKWDSLKVALKTVWKKNEIDEINKRLRNIRAELEFSLVASILSKVDSLALQNDERLQDLNEGTRKLVDAMLQKTDLDEVLGLYTRELIQRQDDSDALAVAHKNEIVNSMLQKADLNTELDTRMEMLSRRHDVSDGLAVQCSHPTVHLLFNRRLLIYLVAGIG